MSATIREARPGEEERILPMYEWLFAPPGSRPSQWDDEHARLALTEAIASPQSSIFVAEDEILVDTDADLRDKAIQSLERYIIGDRVTIEASELHSLSVQGPKSRELLDVALSLKIPLEREYDHALIHLATIVSGHDHHAAFDLFAVVLPSTLALYSAFPNQGERHA